MKVDALGHRLIKSHPDAQCCKFYRGQEVGVVLVEARCNGSVVLELVEEPLDEVAAPVDARTERGRVGAMAERANVCGRALGRDPGAQRIAVVAAIGEHDALARQRTKHVLGAAAVVCLPLGQLQCDGEPARIDERVDFGRKPTAGTAHATTSAAFFSPLAAC